MKTIKFALIAALATSISTQSLADEDISAVRAAAAARLIGKLGTLRGSLKPEDRSVFLTMEMIRDRIQLKNRLDVTGRVPKNVSDNEPPKLPPIVLDIGPASGRVIERVMTGSIENGLKRKTLMSFRKRPNQI